MNVLKLTLKTSLTVVALICGLSSSFSQGFFSAYEGQLYQRTTLLSTLGVGAYGGELAGPMEFSRQNSMANPSFFVGLSYRVTNNLSVRGQLGTTSITISDPVPQWKEVGVNGVQTTILEPSISLEIDLISRERIDINEYNFNVGFILGIGTTAYYPYTTDTDESMRAKRVTSTGGATNGFGNFESAYLLGLNFQYYINNQTSVGVEMLTRYSTSDFLDGIGPTQYGLAKDYYYTASVTIRYTLQANIKRYNYQNYLKRMRKKHPLR